MSNEITDIIADRFFAGSLRKNAILPALRFNCITRSSVRIVLGEERNDRSLFTRKPYDQKPA
jgi:hypothetical protein